MNLTPFISSSDKNSFVRIELKHLSCTTNFSCVSVEMFQFLYVTTEASIQSDQSGNIRSENPRRRKQENSLRRPGVRSRSSVESVNFPPCSLGSRPPGVLSRSSFWFVSSLVDAAFWLDEQRLQNRTVTTRHAPLALSRYPLGHSNRLKRRRVSVSPPSVTATERERPPLWVHLARPSLSPTICWCCRMKLAARRWCNTDDDDDDALM